MVALTEYEEISNTVADFIKHNRANDHSDMFDTIHNRFYAAFVVKRSKSSIKFILIILFFLLFSSST
jgi:hypothetical protein